MIASVISLIPLQHDSPSGIRFGHYRSQAWRRNDYSVVVPAQSTMLVRQLSTQGQIPCPENIKMQMYRIERPPLTCMVHTAVFCQGR